MLKLFDTHAHYNDERFDEIGGAQKAIEESFASGVVGFINCGTNPESCLESIAIAEKYKNVYAAAGLHPEDAPDYAANIDETLDRICALLEHEKVVAVGEIGLDYHWDIAKPLQHEVFDRQLSIAGEKKMPVIVHDRDAHGKTLEMIKMHPDVMGVMHGYSGSAETAKEYVKMGWYIAFGGPLTYKNAEKVRDACRAVPLDRILLETDCPYLPPVPHRGEVNRSDYMYHTLSVMAPLLGVSEERCAEATLENTKRLFNISF